MATTEILIQLLLAGLLGITGQLLRIVVGMKKLNEKATQAGVSTKDMIVVSSMVVSILIGFTTGILAWLAITDWENNFFDSKQRVLGIIAAGYSGTDFIEGFMSKYLPRNYDNNQQQNGGDNNPPVVQPIPAAPNTPPADTPAENNS